MLNPALDMSLKLVYYIVTLETKYKHLGSFQCEIEAAKAYDAAAKEVFGVYARLNFPEDGTRSAICVI